MARKLRWTDVRDIAIELDGLRLITWRGAARADRGLPFAREAALARKLASDKGMRIGLDGVQLLGSDGATRLDEGSIAAEAREARRRIM